MREYFENENKEMEKSLGHPLAASPEQQLKEIEEKIDNLHPLKAHFSIGDFPQACLYSLTKNWPPSPGLTPSSACSRLHLSAWTNYLYL